MSRIAIQSAQFGLVPENKQAQRALISEVIPASPLGSEARKGQLYLVVEATDQSKASLAACELVASVIQRTFYRDSSSSITSALRAAIRAANKALYEHNFKHATDNRVLVGLTCAIVRDTDLFLIQVQPAQAYILSEGRIRALPSHAVWDPTSTNALPFAQATALGASLFVEPELYRASIGTGGGALLCSSNFAQLLNRTEVEARLGQDDAMVMLERLEELAHTHELDNPHALVIRFTPEAKPHNRQVVPSKSTTHTMQGPQMAGMPGWADKLKRTLRRRPERSNQAVPDKPEAEPIDQMQRMPEEPTHSRAPIPRAAPINLGDEIGDRYARLREVRADTAPLRLENLPPSTFLGEGTVPVSGSRRIDLSSEETISGAGPYRPRYEERPLVDLTWGERLALPFQRMSSSINGYFRERHVRRTVQPQRPIHRGQGLSYRRKGPPFSWALLLGLLLMITILVIYGMNLSFQNDQQIVLEYFTVADEQLATVRSAEDTNEALVTLEFAREAIDELRSSALITTTNPALWLRYQELQREYERALASVQRITFLDEPVVVAVHPLATGRFADVIVPPVMTNVTDTNLLERLQYIYAVDIDTQNSRLYRIPQEGGRAEPFLSPGQGVGSTVVGPVRAATWRIDQVVAIDEAASGFGYYFRTGSSWNYAKLGASEIWRLRDRLRVSEYGGNLYVWGAVANEVLRFRSGSYSDAPDYWLDVNSLADVDLSTVVDMAVDGSIYLLRADGTVLVFSQGQFVGEVKPEAINPPLTIVRGFVVTGTSPEDGHFFLIDTLNERILQMEKVSGTIIQQIKVRADGSLRLDELNNLTVTNDGIRTKLYLVNANQIIQAELPAAPRSFRESGEGTP